MDKVTITAAQYAFGNPNCVIATTTEVGDIVVHKDEQPDLWAQVFEAVPVPRPAALPRHIIVVAVRSAFREELTRVLGDELTQASLQREATYLLNLVRQGIELTPEQASDAALFAQINEWEAAMIDRREVLIASGGIAPGANPSWPSPPPGVTADWLAGF